LKKPAASILLVSIIFVSTFFVGGAFASSNEQIPVIVGFKGLPDAALIHAFSGQISYEYSIIPAIACKLPTQAVDALQKNPKIAYVEQDAQVFALDAELDNSWGVKRIGAGTVHELPNKGEGINVAVLDTGINLFHEDLITKGGYDFVNQDADPNDDNGHGTHCAGIIAALDNDKAVVGVAPEANLYAVKVLDSNGNGYTSNIIAGIQWSVNNGIQVISMSLGSTVGDNSLKAACDFAYNSGIVVVAAAGNNGAAHPSSRSNIIYPAKYDSVIAVGATDSYDRRASFSCTGSELEIMAPGVNILSTYIDVSPDDGRNIDTLYMSGTSMACPHVAGTAALVLNSQLAPADDSNGNGKWDAQEVRAKLVATADDLGVSGKDNLYGYGLVDADEAAPIPNVDKTAPTIADLTPADAATIKDTTPEISAVLSDPSGVKWASIQMELDATDVTSELICDQTTGLVTYQPDLALLEKTYTVSLTAADTLQNTATNTWTFTIDTTPPAQVTGLTVDSVSSSSLNLAWNPVGDAAKYNIYRDDIQVATTTTPAYTDTGLEASTTYEYKVTAVDIAGNEGDAAIVSATTQDASLNVLLVSDISMSLGTRKSGPNTFVWGIAQITVVDGNGQAVAGATVSGNWQVATTDSDTGITDNNGAVSLTSDSIKNPKTALTFTFIIDNVALNGWTYQPNSLTTGTIKTQ
jgi:subtilisin